MTFGPLETLAPNIVARFRHDLRDEINADLAILAARGDELYAHISDVYGCDRASWARRSGLPLLQRDPATNWKLAMGHAVEDYVASAIGRLWLSAAEGLSYSRNERIAWNPYSGNTRRHLTPDDTPLETELIGHVDLQLQAETDRRFPPQTMAVGEIKSVWFGKELPTIAEPRYIQQAASYAEAVSAEDFFVQVLAVTIHGGKTALELAPTFWLKTANHRAWVINRAREVVEATRPTSFEPPAEPPLDWLCRVCGYGECPLNINPLRRNND